METNKLTKLKADLSAKNTGNKKNFTDFIVVYTGVKPTEYRKKLKNSLGEIIKDEKGNDKRSSTISGYTYTFNQLGTAKIVKVVFKEKINLGLLDVYILSGLGYEFIKSSMFFIDESAVIKNYA